MRTSTISGALSIPAEERRTKKREGEKVITAGFGFSRLFTDRVSEDFLSREGLYLSIRVSNIRAEKGRERRERKEREKTHQYSA